MLAPRIHAVLVVVIVLACAIALPAQASAGVVRTTPKVRAAAAAVARKQVGKPYVSGATGPRTFDCSGLVVFAYRLAGSPLAVRTSQQMAAIGASIRRSAIRPGDLIFAWTKHFGHVGIAVDATHYVHAPAPGRRVIIATIPSGAALIGVRRL